MVVYFVSTLSLKQGQGTNYLLQQSRMDKGNIYIRTVRCTLECMTYSKVSSSAIKWNNPQIVVNRSSLFVHFSVLVNFVLPDIKISRSLSSSTSSSRSSPVLVFCSLSGNPLISFNSELYKIAGSLNLKLLISSCKQ